LSACIEDIIIGCTTCWLSIDDDDEDERDGGGPLLLLMTVEDRSLDALPMGMTMLDRWLAMIETTITMISSHYRRSCRRAVESTTYRHTTESN
jgi:hypothetical protein